MKSHASMNRIYRLVWNAALNLWVAVAENARGSSKAGSGRSGVAITSVPTRFTLRATCRAALPLLASLALLSPQVQAGPAGGVVSAGSGSVATNGNTTTITQGSQNLAIDWNTFSTAAHEAIVFSQPNAQAIALNRIIGASPSELLGSLSANGQVFILNPNGVLFGAGSQVNVGGLVASTLSMSNADFMAGNHVFSNSGTSGAVVNQGSLSAAPGGYIALLAPEVRNEGIISATLGTALLAAGNKVTLKLDNGSLLGYSIDQGAINALAENKQLIQADGGQVLLSARALDSLTTASVNNTGIIEARTLQNKAGRILLMGDMDVGTVSVGGTLDASAPNGGDGGFIETSAAHISVAKDARITTLAAQGKTGTWLLDPVNMTIAGGTGAAAADTIYESTLEAASSNVVIEATDSITASGAFVDGDVTLQSGVNLTIRTTGASGGTGIDLSSSTHGAGLAFKTSGGGSISMATGNASQSLKVSTLSVSGNGAITLAPVGALEMTGNAVQTAGGAITLSGNSVKLAASTVDAGGGDITINGAGASATHSVEITNVGAARSTVQTSGTGKITISGSLSSGGASATGGSAGGVVVTGSSITSGTGAITITGHAGGVSTGGQMERGFRLDAGTLIASAGDISLAGTVSGNQPILPAPYFGTGSMGGQVASGATVSSTGGNVTLSGTLNNTSHFSGTGLAVDGKVQSGASKKIALVGTANVGTWVSGQNFSGVGTGLSAGSSFEAVAGTGGLDITGTVSASSISTSLIGVTLAGAISSTGDIVITGTSNAPSAPGVTAVDLAGGTLTGLGTASITIRGSGVPAPAPAPNYDVALNGTAVSTAGGDIRLLGDRIKIGSTVNSGSGRTVIAPTTIYRAITLGGGDETNALNLSSAEINLITASVLQIGSTSNMGGISIGNAPSPIAPAPSPLPAISLLNGGAITQTAGFSVDKLNAVGSSVTLNHAGNQIGEISGRSTAGAFQVTSSKAAPLTVGTVDGVAGINSGANATVLTNLNGAIAQTQAITAGSVTASSTGGLNLGHAGNQAGSFNLANSSSGDIVLVNAGATTLDSIVNSASGGNVNITALTGNLGVKTVSGNAVSLRADGGAITDAQGTGNNITGTSLTASARDGLTLKTDVSGNQTLSTTGASGDISITAATALNTSNFSITTDAASTQTVSLASGAGITVGSAFGNSQDHLKLVATAGNIAVNGTLTAKQLTLSTPGTSTQSAAIAATGLELLGSGTHTLTHASNAVSTLAGNTGNIDYAQAGALAIGSVNSAGLSASGKVLVRTTGAAGDITLNNTVTSGSAASDSLVLAAGRNFINNAGATPLNAGTGRYLVYSTDPSANTLGSFSPANAVFGRSYAANPPSDLSMTALSGSHLVYRSAALIPVSPASPASPATPGASGWGSPALSSAYASALTSMAEGVDSSSRLVSGAAHDDAGALAAAAAEAGDSDEP